MPQTPSSRPAVAVAVDAGSYVDWPAILGGAILAAALSFVLLTFGSAIGLTVASAEPGEGVSLMWISIASGIWFVWVAISSFAAGGYLAGRLRRPVEAASIDEVETRDGAHGVLVWATGALFGALLATSGVSGLVGSVGAAAGTTAQVASEAVAGTAEYLGGRLMRGGGEAATTPGAPGATAQAPAAIEPGEIAGLLTRGLADGEFSPEDRDYLAGLVAERTGQTPEQAAAAVDAARTEAQELYDAALETAEQARVAAAIAAFVIAATLMAGAAAGYFAAVVGGDHRDRRLPFRSLGR